MARRRVLALGLGGLAGLRAQTLIGGRKAMAQGTPQGTPETVVYVSNAGSKEGFVLAMNRATGALELIEKNPVARAPQRRRGRVRGGPPAGKGFPSRASSAGSRIRSRPLPSTGPPAGS